MLIDGFQRMMNSDEWFWPGLGFLLGVGLFFLGFYFKRRKDIIDAIPTSKIRSLAMGLVEIEGKAEALVQLWLTPISKKKAVYCEVVIEEKRGKHWYDVLRHQTKDPFSVVDDTGRVMVDPEGAEFHLKVDHEYSSMLFGENSKQLLAGLEDLGVKTRTLLGFNRTFRCKETFILPGDPIYVMGTAAGRAGGVQLGNGGSDEIVIRKGRDFFCISDENERELSESFGGAAIMTLFGGPVLTIFSFSFLARFFF